MHYQLFIPGTTDPVGLIEQAGLTECYGRCGMPVQKIIGGATPNGGPGVLLTWNQGTIDHQMPVYDSNFDWRCIGKYWIGTNPSSPVTPIDLARKRTTPGFEMALMDNQVWSFPTYMRLEHHFTIDTEGQMHREPLPKNRSFFDRCLMAQSQIFECMDLKDYLHDRAKLSDDTDLEKFSDEEVTITIPDGLYLVADALQMNYRINFEIALALNLFDENLLMKSICRIIELPEIVEYRQQKKNSADVELTVT